MVKALDSPLCLTLPDTAVRVWSLQLLNTGRVCMPTSEAGLQDTLEVGAIFIATQPQLLVHIRQGQVGSGLRLHGTWVF